MEYISDALRKEVINELLKDNERAKNKDNPDYCSNSNNKKLCCEAAIKLGSAYCPMCGNKLSGNTKVIDSVIDDSDSSEANESFASKIREKYITQANTELLKSMLGKF
jgi:hypothetical protein